MPEQEDLEQTLERLDEKYSSASYEELKKQADMEALERENEMLKSRLNSKKGNGYTTRRG